VHVEKMPKTGRIFPCIPDKPFSCYYLQNALIMVQIADFSTTGSFFAPPNLAHGKIAFAEYLFPSCYGEIDDTENRRTR
jgi:hypothetical protein